MKGYLFKASQLFEDLKTSGIVLRCAWRFRIVAAAAGAIISVVVSQPGTVGTVRVFEAHKIAILYGSAINSVPGEDLEGVPVVAEPVVSCHGANCPVNINLVSVWDNIGSKPITKPTDIFTSCIRYRPVDTEHSWKHVLQDHVFCSNLNCLLTSWMLFCAGYQTNQPCPTSDRFLTSI